MTLTTHRVAGCIIYIRPTYPSMVHLLSYLVTQLARTYKAGNISETVEDRAKAIINGLYKVIVWLSIAAKMYDLE